MAIISLEHVQLAMPRGEEAQAENFYENLLGLPRIPKPENLAKRGGAWFQKGNIKIHLGVEDGFSPARKAHPAFLVSDLKSLIKKLNDAGFATKDDEPLEGYRRTYVDDPFGNRIELMQKNA